MIFPVGVQYFERIRTDGDGCVEKTVLVFKLASDGFYNFLKCPHHSGKSLPLSTRETYFEEEKELFDGQKHRMMTVSASIISKFRAKRCDFRSVWSYFIAICKQNMSLIMEFNHIFVRKIIKYKIMDNNSIKNNIIRLRKSRNMSQTEMADTLGISRTAYRNIERGETKLINDNVSKIAEKLEVASEVLLLGWFTEVADSEQNLEEPNGRYQSVADHLISSYSKEVAILTNEVERLSKKVASLEEQTETLKDLVKSKEEIISMMKKLNVIQRELSSGKHPTDYLSND